MAFRNLPEMPCGPILELHGQRKRFHVPYGLKRLIEDMTREVLRYQPENVYEFLAVFMDVRLQKKLNEEAKNQRRKSWQQHRWSWQGGSILEPEELKEFLENLPAPVEQVNKHAVVIQAAFRGYQARKKVKEIRKSIQLDDERRNSLRKSLEGKQELGGVVLGGEDSEEEKRKRDESKNRRNTLDITEQNATDEELRSAIIIQSAFRGMHARNEVKKLRVSLTEGKRLSESEPQQRKSIQDEPSKPAPATDNVEHPPEIEEPAKPSDEVAATDAPQVEVEAPAVTDGEVTAPELPAPETAPPLEVPEASEVQVQETAVASPVDGDGQPEATGEEQKPAEETKAE